MSWISAINYPFTGREDTWSLWSETLVPIKPLFRSRFPSARTDAAKSTIGSYTTQFAYGSYRLVDNEFERI
jgi:hypothetical protein